MDKGEERMKDERREGVREEGKGRGGKEGGREGKLFQHKHVKEPEVQPASSIPPLLLLPGSYLEFLP